MDANDVSQLLFKINYDDCTIEQKSAVSEYIGKYLV